MKIAHVTSGLSRHGAGVAGVVEALSGAQSAAGADVRVFGMEDDDWIATDRARWRGAPVTALKTRGPTSLGYMPDLAQKLHDYAPDIVHHHGLWTSSSLTTLRWHRATCRPFVISIHGMLSSIALGYGQRKKAIVRWLYQDALFASASAFYATHPGEVEEIRAFGLEEDRITTLPLGIIVPQLPSDLAPEPTRRILSLGRLHHQKGLDRLIDAWALLEAEFPNWSLDIAGPSEGGYDEALRRRAADAGLTRVTIRPPVTGEERDRTMAGAEVFALPTLSENFALTVAESLAMEVPVIATTGAPWKGLVDNGCGWWIEQGVEPLAGALREAMQLDSATRADMGQKGRAWMIEAFDWSVLAPHYLNAYRKIAATHTAHR